MPSTEITDTPDDDTPVRGWTPERMTRFLDHLALRGNVRASCKRVGLSREAAYRLRRRDPLFARGWAAAMVKAHDASIEVLADRAIDGIEEEIYHRGEVVGTRRKYDTRLLLAHIARLDKAAEDEAAQADAGRFDELLARIGGEYLPRDMNSEDGVLPLDRASVAQQWGEDAELALERNQHEEDEGESLDEAARAARADACVAAYRQGRADGARRWDGWFKDACTYVDWATGWLDESPAPGLPGVSPLPRRECDAGAEFFPRTVSDVSTGALAVGLADAAHGTARPPELRSVREGG